MENRVIASAVGSMPGEDYAEAVRVVAGELPDLPAVPELPARGAVAGLTGRGVAVVAELGFDLQPAGWRLTDAPGIDHRRARSLLAQDLDVVEELLGGREGTLKIQVAGPWTLAATIERPRGDKLLADRGARRELAQALAEGITGHVADVRRRVPGADIVVQLDEPALPAVLAGSIPTSSGFGRHRTVHPPEASAALAECFAAIAEAGASGVAHCCAGDAPVDLFRGAGADGISLDVGVLAAQGYDPLAQALQDGASVHLGVVPSTDAGRTPTDRQLVDQVHRLLDMLGFAPEEVAGQLVLTPTCGLAGATPAHARTALSLARESAVRVLAD